MVVVRLSSSGGKKKFPFRHVVVADKRTKRDSYIEKLGYFNPIKNQLQINTERLQYWLRQGAKVEPKSRATALVKQWMKQTATAVTTGTHDSKTA